MAEYNMPQYILREFKVTDARVSLPFASILVNCSDICRNSRTTTHFLSLFRMVNQGQFVSSNSQIGQSKECQNRVKDSSILLVRCTKLKNSLVKMVRLQCTAGKTVVCLCSKLFNWLLKHLGLRRSKTINENYPVIFMTTHKNQQTMLTLKSIVLH